MKKLILSLLILPFLFSCQEETFTETDIDYSQNAFPVEFKDIFPVEDGYGFIFEFQGYAIDATSIKLNLDVDLNSSTNNVDLIFNGSPSNSFYIFDDGPKTYQINGLMPSRNTDMYIINKIGVSADEPAYVTGYIEYAIYRGDTIQNINPKRFSITAKGATLE